jgi:hypothetical protein
MEMILIQIFVLVLIVLVIYSIYLFRDPGFIIKRKNTESITKKQNLKN